jgi:exonuclease SbcC
MKILSIRLKNLASLAGEHFIDFESQPLASAGLIAIVGKTGAGKSTILDAMCLALFNQMPRLKNSDGKIQDVDGSELATNSPLTVLRRGTGHGFAELCFMAQNQKTYLVRWEIKRAKEQATTKLQKIQRSLTCLTDGVVLADKVKAVDELIQQITQLSFEQFTRAVLLAQSEVTVFLKARDSERGELLEYLTNSSIFGRIGQLAFEKTKHIKQAREQLQERLGHIEILSDEQFAELQQQYTTLQQHYLQSQQQKNRLEQQQQWFAHKHQLDAEIVLKQQDFDRQQQIQQTLTPDKILLKQLHIFSAIRPAMIQHQDAATAQQQLHPHITALQQQFAGLSQHYDATQKQYHATEHALQQFQHFEQQHREHLQHIRHDIKEREFFTAEYHKLKDKLSSLNTLQTPLIEQETHLTTQIQTVQQQLQQNTHALAQHQQFNPLDTGLNIHIQQLQRFIQHYQGIEQQLGQIDQARQQLAQQQNQLHLLTQQSGDIAQLQQHIEQLQQHKEQQLNQLHQLQLIQERLQQYIELQNQLNNLQQQQITLSKTQQQQQQHNQQLEALYHTAKQQHLNLQQILQQQRLLHAENIEHLRAELHDNEPCMVCGSTQHPYRENNEALSKALFALQQQQQQQAADQEQQQLHTWQQAQQELSRIHANIEQNQHTTQHAQSKLLILKQEIEQQLLAIHITLDLQQDATQHFSQIVQQQQDDCHRHSEQLQQKQQQLKQLQQLIDTIQQQQHLLDTAQQLQHQVQDIFNCLKQSEQQHWQQTPCHVATQLLPQLQQRLQLLNLQDNLNQQLQQLIQHQQKLTAEIAHLNQQQAEYQHTLFEITEKGKANNQHAITLIHTMTHQTVEKPNEWLNQHEQQGQQYQQDYQQQKQQFEHIRQQYEQQKSQLEQLKTQAQHYQQQIEQSDVKIQAWLNQHTELQRHDCMALLHIDYAQEQDIRNTLADAEKQLNATLATLNTVQEQLKTHMQQQPDIEFSELQRQLEQQTIDLTDIIEQRDHYKVQLELQQQNLAKRQNFAQDIERIQQEEHRWNKISSLVGDATGKKFRDYAQQYHLDILLEYANQQLAMLSQRYTLQRLEHSLSLAILDHDMDGEKRAVASLSGGESFLTALALSLAIANMASGSMKIESLFIDEGFGTLDASSLHLVMNALDQLQDQGRKVVLISHIQDMHERIPVQIQVKPLGAGASTIEIVG